ncbi:GGDEF domain-containing protein [Clostridium estertheticum]|nr:GGDEF domain-containing protein [Clostridium estertheticum]
MKPHAIYDEFYILADEINNMINRLEESQSQIVESKNELSIVNENLQNEIIERKKTEEKIEHLAYFDSLTELPNRVYFRECLNRAIPLSDRIGKAIAAIFLDLDGFKMINDSMGHDAGSGK